LSGLGGTFGSQKQSEDILRSYRDVIEGANSIILRWDRQGTILYMNPFGRRLFGFRAKELFGKSVMETIVSASSLDGKDLDAMIKAIIESPDRFAKNENENICKDGRRVWINWTNKPVLDESGEYVQILSIGNDVTERKRAEEAPG
jgi:two-component system sensor histidine kinase/response regulator